MYCLVWDFAFVCCVLFGLVFIFVLCDVGKRETC